MACNTAAVGTEEKKLDAVVPMQNVALQSEKNVKDAQVSHQIETNSVASQMELDQPDQKGEDCCLTCFKCNGTKVNRNGLPCKKCLGRGVLDSAFFQEVTSMIKDEIKEYTTECFKMMLSEYFKEKMKTQSEIIHPGFICDGCNMNPIKGIRYKCSQCRNFDLCENCESKTDHKHPFLKIREPKNAPVFCFTQPQMQGAPQPMPSPMQEAPQPQPEPKMQGCGASRPASVPVK